VEEWVTRSKGEQERKLGSDCLGGARGRDGVESGAGHVEEEAVDDV
jgi:hypothetical protein